MRSLRQHETCVPTERRSEEGGRITGDENSHFLLILIFLLGVLHLSLSAHSSYSFTAAHNGVMYSMCAWACQAQHTNPITFNIEILMSDMYSWINKAQQGSKNIFLYQHHQARNQFGVTVWYHYNDRGRWRCVFHLKSVDTMQWQIWKKHYTIFCGFDFLRKQPLHVKLKAAKSHGC